MKTRKIGLLTLKRDSGGEWSVVKCDERAVSVSIPATVDGEPVTSIRERAFADCAALEELLFPDEVDYVMADVLSLEIGNHAFDGCVLLREIELPSLVSVVGWGAFRGCTSLERVSLPDCYVSPYAFCECEALAEVSPLRTISEGVFSHCKSLAYLPIAKGAEVIEEEAFYHCYGLVDVTIPSSIKRIDALAFRSCYNLKRVSFECPDGWYSSSRYVEGERPIDLTSPEENAAALSRMDFDDGVRTWVRR